MTRIELPSITLGIVFIHSQVKQEDLSKFGLVSNTIRSTHCELYNIMSGVTKLISEATARCSVDDNFKKSTGRKIALTRALRKTGFGKAERRLVWEAYRKTVRL